jgi:hypothetical protein
MLVSKVSEVFIAELRDGEAMEKRYQERTASMRQDQRFIPSGRDDYGMNKSPASWWHRLRKDLLKIRWRNKDA